MHGDATSDRKWSSHVLIRDSFASDALKGGSLHDYQNEAVEYLGRTPRALLALDVGMGKTVVALAHVGRLYDTGQLVHGATEDSSRVLIVCPANLVAQWVAMVRRLLPSLSVHATTATGKTPQSPPDIEIVSPGLVRNRKLWNDSYGLVVVDELAAGYAGGKLWKAVGGVTGRATRVLGLTAIPYPGPTDAWFMASLIQPDILAQSDYEDRCVRWWPERLNRWGTPMPPSPLGLQPGAAEEVADLLRPFTFYRTPESVGLTLPTVIDEVIPVELTQAQLNAIKRINPSHEAAGRLTDLAELHANGTSALADAAVAYLLGQPRDRLSVIWSELTQLNAITARLLRAAGRALVEVDGKVAQAARPELIAQFAARDSKTNVLLGTNAIDTGTDGLQISGLMISCGQNWNPSRAAQRIGRLRRIGSPHQAVTHVHVLPATSYAKRKDRRVQEKAAETAAVLAHLSGTLVGSYA